MRLLSIETLSHEQLQQLALVDLAFEILREEKQPLAFGDLIEKIKEYKDIAKDEYEERIARFYTNLNLDGRFISIGENYWGLRGWYPVDQKKEDIEVPEADHEKQHEAPGGGEEEALMDAEEETDEYEDESEDRAFTEEDDE